MNAPADWLLDPVAPPAVYFDLDATLVGGHVVFTTAHFLRVYRPVGMLEMLLDTVGLLAAEREDRSQFNRRLNRHLAGLSRTQLTAEAEHLPDRRYGPRPFAGTAALLEAYRSCGTRIVLVTGSVESAIAPLARRLGVDRVLANRLEFDGEQATGRLLEPVVAGPNKVRLAAEDAAAHGHDLRSCHAWGDSGADVPLLSAAGRAFAVNPDRKLSRIAPLYGWPIVDLSTPRPTVRPS